MEEKERKKRETMARIQKEKEKDAITSFNAWKSQKDRVLKEKISKER